MTTDNNLVPFLQKMFDRAVIGLASQHFQLCRVGDKCRYSDGEPENARAPGGQ